MKNRDLIVVLLGAVSILVFVAFMYNYYMEAEKIEIVKRTIKLDSIIVKEQRNLHKKDSVIETRTKNSNSKINYKLSEHDKELKRISEELEKLK